MEKFLLTLQLRAKCLPQSTLAFREAKKKQLFYGRTQAHGTHTRHSFVRTSEITPKWRAFVSNTWQTHNRSASVNVRLLAYVCACVFNGHLMGANSFCVLWSKFSHALTNMPTISIAQRTTRLPIQASNVNIYFGPQIHFNTPIHLQQSHWNMASSLCCVFICRRARVTNILWNKATVMCNGISKIALWIFGQVGLNCILALLSALCPVAHIVVSFC